jgi:hypothetical protein
MLLRHLNITLSFLLLCNLYAKWFKSAKRKFYAVMIRISSILRNTIKHPVYINVHKFKKVMIDALPNSAISTIFFKISILLLTVSSLWKLKSKGKTTLILSLLIFNKS